MRSYLGTLFLVQLLAGCGGNVDTSKQGDPGGSSGSTAASKGGTSSGGGEVDSAGGAPVVPCPRKPVTFQIMPAANTMIAWCLGEPGGCSAGLDISNSSGPLELSNFCQISCDTCQTAICHPIVCRSTLPLTEQGETMSWDGSYYEHSTCGASATSCQAATCATPGTYTFQVCGFLNPTPAQADGCQTAPSTTPHVCTSVDFTYPATSPVILTMPVGLPSNRSLIGTGGARP
jgi:hypothetical protein